MPHGSAGGFPRRPPHLSGQCWASGRVARYRRPTRPTRRLSGAPTSDVSAPGTAGVDRRGAVDRTARVGKMTAAEGRRPAGLEIADRISLEARVQAAVLAGQRHMRGTLGWLLFWQKRSTPGAPCHRSTVWRLRSFSADAVTLTGIPPVRRSALSKIRNGTAAIAGTSRDMSVRRAGCGALNRSPFRGRVPDRGPRCRPTRGFHRFYRRRTPTAAASVPERGRDIRADPRSTSPDAHRRFRKTVVFQGRVPHYHPRAARRLFGFPGHVAQQRRSNTQISSIPDQRS